MSCSRGQGFLGGLLGNGIDSGCQEVLWNDWDEME